jgi:hypothetical protein
MKIEKKSLPFVLLIVLHLIGAGLHFGYHFYLQYSEFMEDDILVVENLFIAVVLSALIAVLIFEKKENLHGVLILETLIWGFFTVLIIIYHNTPTTLSMMENILGISLPQSFIMGVTGISGTILSILCLKGKARVA